MAEVDTNNGAHTVHLAQKTDIDRRICSNRDRPGF